VEERVGGCVGEEGERGGVYESLEECEGLRIREHEWKEEEKSDQTLGKGGTSFRSSSSTQSIPTSPSSTHPTNTPNTSHNATGSFRYRCIATRSGVLDAGARTQLARSVGRDGEGPSTAIA
jgi:hypothetical protein